MRIDDATLFGMAERILPAFGFEDRIFPGTLRQFRACFDLLAKFFELPTVDGRGFTPASLRAGGATFLYLCGAPLDDIRWKGRCSSMRTLEIYIQEVASMSILHSLPANTRGRIRAFSDASAQILARCSSNSVP